MEIKMLEHINLITSNLEKMEKWYSDILGLRKGYRPPFSSSGAWMYENEVPLIHLVKGDKSPRSPIPQMEHFAMRSVGLKQFLERLELEGIPYSTARVPELRIFQVNISDPEGNNMHLDFPPEEGDAMDFGFK
jgi:catechol 2,3-dioxygenase-like lactoylglutathione lyase family enzyme